MHTVFNKHPFIKILVQRVAIIAVTILTIVLCLAGLSAVAGIFATEPATETEFVPVFEDGYNELRSIKITGTIIGSPGDTSGFDSFAEMQTSGYEVKEKLYAAAEDELVKGIILEINSPGGAIYGSRAIADGVKYYKEKTGNPVYAYIEGLGASGAYWAAASADKIFTDYGSDVGSIGIIMGPFKYYDKVVAEDSGLFDGGVVTQNGVETTTLSAGKSKDLGNPYRRITNEELAVLQRAVNNEYDEFVKYISKQRKIPAETIRNTIGAMSYDNKTAQELKLIDVTGSREDAYQALAGAAGVEDDYQVWREEYMPGLVDSLLGAVSQKPEKQASTSSACVGASGPLAYHGNVSSLCIR